MLASTGSRPLREDEIHGRAKKMGASFDAAPSWLQVPMLAEWVDEDYDGENNGPAYFYREFPIMLVSSIVTWHPKVWIR